MLRLVTGKFEKFRNNNSLKNYGLSPIHYLTAPGLSWNAMLKMTKIDLELIPDPDMYILFEKDTKGVIFYISNRCSKTNNEYLKSQEESKHIIYLDTNNLYGYPMSIFLLTSWVKWIDPKQFDLNEYASNSSTGYVLKVDLEYSKELRELRNDCPLDPYKIKICYLSIN